MARAALRGAAVFAGAIAILALIFALAAWIGSSLARNPDWREPAEGVTILVETNGVHTAIVMPRANAIKDWSARFPLAHLRNPQRAYTPERAYTHVSVGWGAREIFLQTPRWRDLSLAHAARAALGTSALIHAAHYVRPAPGRDIRALRLRPREYARLVRAIEASLALPTHGSALPGYGDHDVFYPARGRYHLFSSCNQWTSDRLAEAGVRIGRYTPFAGGVMKWIAPPR